MDTTAASVNPAGTMYRFIELHSSLVRGRSPRLRPGRTEVRVHREGRERLLLGLVVVEHHDQLGHDEQILETLPQPTQLDLTAATPVVREGPHDDTDRDRVEGLAFLHVQDQATIS